MDHASYLDRARGRGVNPIVYWLVRGVLQPFAHLYWRLSRIGREHIPDEGPVIFASNHRSFLDPFVIGMRARRPLYYVAKKELFRKPLTAWFLNSLGAFPIDRGNSDEGAMGTNAPRSWFVGAYHPLVRTVEPPRSQRNPPIGVPPGSVTATLGPARRLVRVR